MNHITVSGMLGRDPEMTYTPKGTACTKFSVADHMDPKEGQERGDTQWWNCIVWGKQAEYFAGKAKKGSMVNCFGRVEKRTWKGKDGKDQTALEVIVDRFQILSSTKQETQKPGSDDRDIEEFPF